MIDVVADGAGDVNRRRVVVPSMTGVLRCRAGECSRRPARPPKVGSSSESCRCCASRPSPRRLVEGVDLVSGRDGEVHAFPARTVRQVERGGPQLLAPTPSARPASAQSWCRAPSSRRPPSSTSAGRRLPSRFACLLRWSTDWVVSTLVAVTAPQPPALPPVPALVPPVPTLVPPVPVVVPPVPTLVPPVPALVPPVPVLVPPVPVPVPPEPVPVPPVPPPSPFDDPQPNESSTSPVIKRDRFIASPFSLVASARAFVI